MAADPHDPTRSPLTWGEDGLPRSTLYDDVYFSSDDGLAESRAVFLAGCGLPDAWAGRARFTVGELGFGTGLNIAALLDLWRQTRPDGARLHIFSVEAHPLARQDAARALARWPQIAQVAAALTGRWPGLARGLHRIDLPAFDAVLDLAVMDAGEALAAWDGAADAWFLDGFSPAANPAMWSEDLMRLVAERSAPGARAATFTVAGAVRRGLAAAGFAVDKRPGFGRKRERLEARLEGSPAAQAPPRRIAILGAGIAGASLARAFRALGAEPVVYDPRGPGGGASGNPAALVTPRLDAGLGPPARLYAEALRRAVALYEAFPDAVIGRGVLQLETGERDAARFAAIAASGLFEPGAMAVLSAAQASGRLGEAVPGALAMEAALALDPRPVLDAWAGEVAAARIERLEPGWTLHADDGRVFEADAVCLAAGTACAAFAGLPLQAVRGQASWAEGADLPWAAAFGGYAVPMPGGVLFGAVHDRDDEGEDVRVGDNARNLALLAKGLPRLAERLGGASLQARASIRAAAPDRLPIAGALGRGLFVLSGLGSRGFCTAPVLAEHVAAQAMGLASPLARDLAALVDPGRFEARAARRGASRRGG